MPKATSTTSTIPARSSSAPFQNAQVLRRNQACHQCRRRKLKCDAKRPCSTCVRSHAYAVAHASPGTEHPPHPECTFDDVSEPNAVESQDAPKNRFERLENRISELETMLQEKDQVINLSKGDTRSGYDSSSLFFGLTDLDFDMNQLSAGSALDELADIAALMGNTMIDYSLNNTNAVFPELEVVNAAWPRNLPNPSVVRNLAEAFFNHMPLAKRMFHAPTFLASLSLPPTHPKFPIPAVLYAMCAMGSMFTSDDSTCSSASISSVDGLNETFAETQVGYAVQAMNYALRTTADLFESLQARTIISLWYWYNARWSEACVSFAVSLRYAVPCGLNVCPPFDSLSGSEMSRSSVIPPAANVMEDETRRNTFWIAYMTERHFVAINNFATFLDDQDVAQMLPVRGDQFESGVLVPPRERQWSHDRDVIVNHHEDQIDPFIIHVKATLLLSRVKAFNSRYKIKHHQGDPSMQPNPAGLPHIPRPDVIATSPAFVELDLLISSFLKSFPPHLNNVVNNGVVDVSLLTAKSSAYFAMIILHEGHAHIGHSACVSSCKVLRSARSILDLLYEAYSTSANLATLGVFPMVCWFAACRVLIRFLRSAINAKSDEHIAALRTEVDFIRSVIHDVGATMPHAQHYGKMLSDYLAAICGKEYAQPVGSPRLPGRQDSPSSSKESGSPSVALVP